MEADIVGVRESVSIITQLCVIFYELSIIYV